MKSNEEKNMAMPPHIQKQLIKKRLADKSGKKKIKEIEQILTELPTFTSGAYVDIRKWLEKQKQLSKTKSNVQAQDTFGVKKQGIRQFCLVGMPNIGKSSLLQKLCGSQTKVGNYAFTTLEPIAGTLKVNGALFQVVDLPGLIAGASSDAGMGKRFLGVVRTCDGIILMHDLSKPVTQVQQIAKELELAGIQKPRVVVGSKVDLASSKELQAAFENEKIISLSNAYGEGIDELKEVLWKMSSLIRVFCKEEEQPLILEKGSTVETFAQKLHKDLLKKFKKAKVTGKSAKFANQQVGLGHVLQDGDVVELVLKR